MITLTRDEQTAVVAPRGAALRSWSVAGRELLAHTDPPHAFDGATLMPWPNRIRDGRYAFDEIEHVVDVNEPARRTALHGLAHDVDWAVVSADAERVMLRRVVGREPGYPFAVVGEVVYRLDDAGLTVELSAINQNDEPAPFGCGSHPFLAVSPDDVTIELAAGSFVPVDAERLLPTGPPESFEHMQRELDTCFGHLERNAHGHARVRAGDVTVWMDASFPYVHIYTGDDDPEWALRRTRLAVEPVTCAPDAFNTGLGLITLTPGHRFTGCWGMTLRNEEMT